MVEFGFIRAIRAIRGWFVECIAASPRLFEPAAKAQAAAHRNITVTGCGMITARGRLPAVPARSLLDTELDAARLGTPTLQ